jgi:hypothetical protein
MKARAVLLAAVCGLAACGGGSSKKPQAVPPSAAEQAYLTRMGALCLSAAGPGGAVERYTRFVQSVERVKAPPRFASDHERRVAIANKMLATVHAQRTAAAVRQAYAADDRIDARQGLLDCLTPLEPAARTRTGTLRALAPVLERACADNARRTARARSLAAGTTQLIAEASSERLARLVVAVQPSDAGPLYGGWRDALRTVPNLLRLAAQTTDAGRADALRVQAAKTAAASRKSARKLGLATCAKTGAPTTG